MNIITDKLMNVVHSLEVSMHKEVREVYIKSVRKSVVRYMDEGVFCVWSGVGTIVQHEAEYRLEGMR